MALVAENTIITTLPAHMHVYIWSMLIAHTQTNFCYVPLLFQSVSVGHHADIATTSEVFV